MMSLCQIKDERNVFVNEQTCSVGEVMKAEKKKTWLFLLIAVFMVEFVFVCAGCMSEETRDGWGTTTSYHRSGLTPEPKQMIIDY